MTKANPNNGNEKKPVIFSWDIFKSDIISFFVNIMLKYFNDLQNRNISVL